METKKHKIELAQRRTANGDDEWFLVCNDMPVYGPGNLGVTTGPGMLPQVMLPIVLERTAKKARHGG